MRHRLSLIAALLLASCGGGSTPVPQPVNAPPVFTSPATASAAENAAFLYQASATDPEGNALSYSIGGGADAARFAISPTGALTFVAAPDFEQPGDADRNNVYLVQLRVSDGTNAATLDLAVTVTNVAESFTVRRVASGLSQPLFVAAVPGDSRVFVLEKAGRILLLDPATRATSVFMTVAGTISTSGERGLLGLAAAPDYATTGVFYLYVTNPAGDIEIRRYTRKNGNEGDAASGDTILVVPHPTFDNHNGGWLGFGPHDGMLYIGTGDGGSAGDPNNNAQNLASRLGKILRIDVRSDAFPADPLRDYAIPAGNPFASGTAPEIFAYGFRNPFRAGFDGSSLYIGDVGQDAVEEVDLIEPADAGGNYGWAFREGTQSYRGAAPAGLKPPVTEYGHGTGPLQGKSITGGYVYRGPVAQLQGQYVFGDFVSGNLWTVAGLTQGTTAPASRFVRRNAEFVPDAGAINQIVSFGEDGARNLYIVDFDGEVFEVVPAG